MKSVDATLSRTDTTQEKIKSKAELQAFLAHCTRRHYFFCVKKCGDQSCKICGKPTLPDEVFQQLHQFPDPEKKPGTDRFKSFTESWGKSTSENDRPSMKHHQKERIGTTADTETQKVPVTAANVRHTVVCSVCDKPRCLFAVKKLTQADAAAITQMKEDVNCVCGGTVIPSDDPLSKKVGTRLDIACTSEVSSHYFASKRGLPPVCYKCGCVNPLPISAETAARYQSVHPLCQECKNKGFSLRTRGERKVRR